MIDFFEVHYWPHEGRILTINHPSYATDPTLMHVTLGVPELAKSALHDATTVTAMALAEAGKPTGELVLHEPDGSMWQVSIPGLARTKLRAADGDRACPRCGAFRSHRPLPDGRMCPLM